MPQEFWDMNKTRLLQWNEMLHAGKRVSENITLTVTAKSTYLYLSAFSYYLRYALIFG